MMLHDLVGWFACTISLVGNLLATAYHRKVVMWGWLLFFVGNVVWIVYAISLDTLPLVVYNSVRAIMSLRGAHNNTLKHIKAIKAKERADDHIHLSR